MVHHNSRSKPSSPSVSQLIQFGIYAGLQIKNEGGRCTVAFKDILSTKWQKQLDQRLIRHCKPNPIARARACLRNRERSGSAANFLAPAFLR